MWRVTVFLVTICLLVHVRASPDISLEDLLERLVTLEDWKRETEKEVSTLQKTVVRQGVTIKNLERDLAIQGNLIATLRSFKLDNNQEKHERKVETEDDAEREGQRHNVSDNRIRTADSHNQLPVRTSTMNKRAIAGGVAFTAYLDHDVTQGSKQTIKFNRIITNDGNAYNIHSGIFTCPEAGVYLFSFALGERSESGPRQLSAELVVNSQQVVGAVVETVHNLQDSQGGNTAVVRLNPGDTVWIDVLSAGEHVEGSRGFRLTTFTGLYLYG